MCEAHTVFVGEDEHVKEKDEESGGQAIPQDKDGEDHFFPAWQRASVGCEGA
jgi:hypothetical protein